MTQMEKSINNGELFFSLFQLLSKHHRELALHLILERNLVGLHQSVPVLYLFPWLWIELLQSFAMVLLVVLHGFVRAVACGCPSVGKSHSVKGHDNSVCFGTSII